jgi:plasmid stabilization system protein ParE
LSWAIRVRPRAELDLLLAARWYETQHPTLGAQFIDEIELLIESLASNALLYPERFSGVRRAFSHRFPTRCTFLFSRIALSSFAFCT